MEPQPDHFLAALADQLKSQDRGTVAERVMKRAVELTALREAAGTVCMALRVRANMKLIPIGRGSVCVIPIGPDGKHR